MEIRLANIDDMQIFNEMYTNFSVTDEVKHKLEPIKKEIYEDFLQLEAIYLAVDEGNVVGYAIVVAFEDGEVEILQFSVKEKRKKYGTRFYKLLEDEIRKYDINKISLIALWKEAELFWSRMGFESVNETDKFCKILK